MEGVTTTSSSEEKKEVHALQSELRSSLSKSPVRAVDLVEWKMWSEDERVVLYRLVGHSDCFMWSFWVRFHHFRLLDEQLELHRDNAVVLRDPLPPFPAKRIKMLVDHTNPFFISARFALMRNFLRKTFDLAWTRKLPLYVGFITPGRHSVDVELNRAEGEPQSLERALPQGFLGASRVFSSTWSLIQQAENNNDSPSSVRTEKQRIAFH